MSDLIIGIDLGTTNSLVAYADQRGPHIIEGPGGARILPSVVHIDPATGQPTVGAPAREHAVERPTETIYSVKRLMGKGLEEVRSELPHLAYRVLGHGLGSQHSAANTQQPTVNGQQSTANSGENAPLAGLVDISIAGQRYTPQQISAMILADLKGWGEPHFGAPVTKAVITVPAYFDDAQRQATRDAGRIAGLEVLRIVNEPTAAALAYGLDRSDDATIAVYDLGGGTFDISILRIEKGVFRVLATNGDTHLGGDDFDRQIIGLVQDEIRQQFGQDIDFDPSTQQALRRFAESVKVELSSRPQATIQIDIGGGRTYQRVLTQAEFLKLIDPYIERSLQRCKLAMHDAGKMAGDFDSVVMVGGSTYMPHVRQRVGEFYQAEVYTALNPMEVVAMGAAVQAGIIGGVKRDVLLLDIIPLSLGIETMGGAVAKLITKGTHIPCHAREMFTTYADGQGKVKVHVLQGERELVRDCRSLGQFTLEGLPPMPAGLPKIQVTFLVDASGILSVSAIEQRSGQKASIQIVPSHGLSRDEVTAMVFDSIRHAREDMLEHQLIDLRNQIDLDTAAIEKSLAIVGDEIDPSYKRELVEIIEGIRGMKAWRDAQAMHKALIYMDRKSARLAELAITRTLRENV